VDNALLSVRELTRRFGGFTEVKKVSFALDGGEIMGFILLGVCGSS
jgi:ABC-type branched-subunit amino acid transport system ATPase component